MKIILASFELSHHKTIRVQRKLLVNVLAFKKDCQFDVYYLFIE